jgi:hypothetical protein
LKVHKWWFRPVVIVGSGPSLSDEHCQLIADRNAADACRVIVINDNYRRVANADIRFAGDHPWWKLYSADVKEVAPKIERWSCEPKCREFGVNIWPATAGYTLAEDTAGQIKRGSSWGFMALGLKFRTPRNRRLPASKRLNRSTRRPSQPCRDTQGPLATEFRFAL